MKKIHFILFLLCSVSYAQEVEIGTSFTLEFNSLDENMNFNIVQKDPYEENIAFSKLDSTLTTEPKENQIVGVFGTSNLGSKQTSLLILNSGLKNVLDYDIRIKLPDENEWQKSSNSPLKQGAQSFKLWPYPIEKIDLKSFSIVPKESPSEVHFETKIDSSCIKNKNQNIAYGEQEFTSHVQQIIAGFAKTSDFKLKESLKYEKSRHSEDVSLGDYWPIAESIYPNAKGFKFSTPVSYRRIECPYFEGRVNYYYTEEDKAVKVVSFNWKTFKESYGGIKPETKNTTEKKFTEKYEFLIETVSDLLGKPIENTRNEIDQRKIRWVNKKGINAFMYNFSTDKVYLYFYKE